MDSDELYRYAMNEVTTTAQKLVNARQTPVRIIGEEVVGVFALARTRPRRPHRASTLPLG